MGQGAAVFICKCGGNISNYVDVDAVAERLSGDGGVTKVRIYDYMCSEPGLKLIKETVRKVGADAVVVASCTPRMHRELFRKTAEAAGVNRYRVEIANIREQCAWVHQDDREGATEKALALARGAVAKALRALEQKPIEVAVERSIAIVGGGIAGMTAALQLANMGYDVWLIERSPSLGGNMAKLTKVFPTLDCNQCILTPKMAEVYKHPKIRVLTLAEVVEVGGRPGEFKLRVRIRPRGVDVGKCLSCGTCSRVCPVEVPSEFNQGLGQRKAAYIPFPQAVPPAYVIDFENCTRCGKCIEACPVGAISLDGAEEEVEVTVGAVILATGYELMDLARYSEWAPEHPNVVDALAVERMMDVAGPTGGRVAKPSDGGPVSRVAYVLCAGSRDSERGVPYCSRICCLYAIKQARLLKEMFGADVWLHYIDVRSPGRRYEEFYEKAQEEGVNFVRGKVAEVVPSSDKLTVVAEDTLLGRRLEYEVDLVVLCPAILPSRSAADLARMFKASVDADGFILERHPKLDPISTTREGVFAAGCCLGPKDIQTTVAEAQAAASKAAEFVGPGVRVVEPNKAFLKVPDACDGCGACVEECPEGAIEVSDGKAKVDVASCTGCGACVSACPKWALDLMTLTEEQLAAQIEATLAGSEGAVIVFVDESLPYTAADLAGVARAQYSPTVRFIPVPSGARLRPEHFLLAVAKGASGILVLESPPHEGPLGEAHEITEARVKAAEEKFSELGIDAGRIAFSRIYVSQWSKLPSLIDVQAEMFEMIGPPTEEEIKKAEEALAAVRALR